MTPIIKCIRLKTGKLVVNFHGKQTAAERDNILSEIYNTIFASDKQFYWSDTRCINYMFDYKLPCGLWCENITLNNSLTEICCNVY